MAVEIRPYLSSVFEKPRKTNSQLRLLKPSDPVLGLLNAAMEASQGTRRHVSKNWYCVLQPDAGGEVRDLTEPAQRAWLDFSAFRAWMICMCAQVIDHTETLAQRAAEAEAEAEAAAEAAPSAASDGQTGGASGTQDD